MKFFVITQDLKISGTSQGIIERSFLSKLRKVYPESVIDVLYLSTSSFNDELEILPVNSVSKKVINRSIPFHVKWINRFTSRLFNYLYSENYIYKKYAQHIKKIDSENYDYVFVRSAGLEHETILAMDNLPILSKSIINFHDPFPYTWYKSTSSSIHKNEYLRLRKMISVVQKAKACCASAYYMSRDLQYLYASDKHFYTLPHQFEIKAFDLSKPDAIRKKQAKLQIAYHGALMFGRNIFNVLEAYRQLLLENPNFKNKTEFIIRVKGEGIKDLKQKFGHITNILILDTMDFSNSANEQIFESDINVILENGPYYSNILPGKVPFLASLNKPILVISPERSELRRILKNFDDNVADMSNTNDIKLKLKHLIENILDGDKARASVFENYFSDKSFKRSIDLILKG